jgi:phosphatidate cytidylyltransferase
VPLKRLYSAILLAVPTLAAVALGSPAFEIMIAAGILVLSWEWCRLCRRETPRIAGFLLAGTLLAAVAATAVDNLPQALAFIVSGGAAMLIIAPDNRWLGFGVFYLGLPAMALIWLRHDPDAGRDVVFWLFAVVWASDIGAFTAGRLIGGPKLAPRISPNKTWAGLGGAMIGAMAVGLGLSFVLGGHDPVRAAVLSAGLGLIAQAGDLWESWIKRRFGVKDTSRLIPGHGGLLDRVDALMFAASAVALMTLAGKGNILTWL